MDHRPISKLQTAPRSGRSILRAFGLCVGTIGLAYRFPFLWAFLLCGAAGGMLIVAIALPHTFAAVDRIFDRLQRTTVQAISWIVLLGIFLLIFIPGRLALLMVGDRRFSRSERKDTYWRIAPSAARGTFHRQY